jgi:hypothetical protein
MKTRNLISAYQGAAALEACGLTPEKKFRVLKSHEIRNLHSFCDIMSGKGCDISTFDGFYIGYSIGQIGKEFDLLRFGDKQTINIEIKSELKVAKKEEKILKQMRNNYYYLKFLGRSLKIFTYVENDGFYEYIIQTDEVKKIDEQIVATCIQGHVVNYAIDPDKEFVPSNYLISPFNSTEKFINGQYFLTAAQQKIKEEVKAELLLKPFMYFSISANAGTGKTLLLYDIAKDMIRSGEKPTIIHCGILNEGHLKLSTTYNWNVLAIKSVNEFTVDKVLKDCSMLCIDEAQRIREKQLNMIIDKSIELKIPLIFSYDTKQYLRRNEGRDIEEYLADNYPGIHLSPKKLTTKIRTNKEMASFITNLLSVGSSKDNLNYDCITIDYMNNIDDMKEYLVFLNECNWMTITYTTSQYNADPYDSLSDICEKNAHDVIGQEFSKVVLIMDANFKYNDANKLTAKSGYYSAQGMLYQIITRVVDELKIVVLHNPDLYLKLLEIKAMGE